MKKIEVTKPEPVKAPSLDLENFTEEQVLDAALCVKMYRYKYQRTKTAMTIELINFFNKPYGLATDTIDNWIKNNYIIKSPSSVIELYELNKNLKI